MTITVKKFFEDGTTQQIFRTYVPAEHQENCMTTYYKIGNMGLICGKSSNVPQ